MTGYDEVRTCALGALATTNGISAREVAATLSDLGDDYLLELDSKTAEFVLVAAEAVVGHKLPSPAALGEHQFATLGALLDVILKEI